MTAPVIPLVVRRVQHTRLRGRIALIEADHYADMRRTTPYGAVLHALHPGQAVEVRIRRGDLKAGDRLSMDELIRSVRRPVEIPWRWVDRHL